MKTKTLLFAFLLLTLMAGNAKAQEQTQILTQDFEDEWAGWTFNGAEILVEYGYGSVYPYVNHTPNGNQSFQCFVSYSNDGYLISPQLNSSDTGNGIHVAFYYTNYYLACGSEFKVGYSMDTEDPSDFKWSDPISAFGGTIEYLGAPTGDEGWKLFSKDFPANVKYIAIMVPAGVGSYLYVDDIVVTSADCAIPTIPVATNVAQQSITVQWEGNASSLKYSSLDFYGFENAVVNLGEWTSLGNTAKPWWWSGTEASGHNSNYCVLSDRSLIEHDNYLVSPSLTLGGRITFYAKGVDKNGLKKGHNRENSHLAFKVMVSTAQNPGVADFVATDGIVYTAEEDVWVRYTVELGDFAGQQGHVAICHVVNGTKVTSIDEDYYLAIDDITLYSQKGTLSVDGLAETTISNLTAKTQYAIQLQGCSQWTDPLYIATLPETEPTSYNFVKNGSWSEATNWENWYMPSEGKPVTINARARIPANYVAKAGTITIQKGKLLSIADGGQLQHSGAGVNSSIEFPTVDYYLRINMEKNITGYVDDEGNDNYQLLAFPTKLNMYFNNNYLPGFDANSFDLYMFDQAANDGLEWINYNQPNQPNGDPTPSPFTQIVNGTGYLYANNTGGKYTFCFCNLKRTDVDVNVPLVYSEGKDFAGWNLVGNPFSCNAYLVNNRPFYRLEEVGGESKIVLASNNVITPLEGIFVQANTNGETATFTSEEPDYGDVGTMDFALRKSLTRTEDNLDRIRVMFGEGQNMSHLDIMADPNRLYIPLDGKAMSVVYSQPVGELPLNFEAANDDTFVLDFTNGANDMVYCHLIDNLTGANIDLLQQPEYTFQSKVSDYPSRFKVVFVAKDAEGAVENNEAFAFNSNGSWIVVNEGQATLQVIDLQGRMISSETIEGCVSKTVQAAPGVYVLRLINGENIRVQKVVVR